MRRRGFLLAGLGATTLTLSLSPGPADAASDGPPAHRLHAGSRLLFVSGQVPTDADGAAPEDFDAQCALAWGGVERQLAAAGMGLRHLVRVNVFLARAGDRGRERALRRARFGDCVRPSVGVIVTGIYDEDWRIEIEAIALA